MNLFIIFVGIFHSSKVTFTFSVSISAGLQLYINIYRVTTLFVFWFLISNLLGFSKSLLPVLSSGSLRLYPLSNFSVVFLVVSSVVVWVQLTIKYIIYHMFVYTGTPHVTTSVLLTRSILFNYVQTCRSDSMLNEPGPWMNALQPC